MLFKLLAPAPDELFFHINIIHNCRCCVTLSLKPQMLLTSHNAQQLTLSPHVGTKELDLLLLKPYSLCLYFNI